jgi:hypothetical protein
MTNRQVQARYDITKLILIIHKQLPTVRGDQFRQAILIKANEHLGMALGLMRSVDTQPDIPVTV